MDQKRPRIQDVARAAGVSTATVSRALSAPDMVNAETRARVHEAVAQTGYSINQAARNLRRNRTGGVVALVPNLANPFFSQILSGLASVLSPAGYHLMIADTRTGIGDEALHYADPSRVDGMFVLDGALPVAGLSPRGRKVPMVFVCEWIDGFAAPSVRIDNFAAAKLAILHLARLGHRRIGHVSGPAGNVLSKSRLEGAQAAMAGLGLSLAPDAIIQGDFTLQSGRAAALHWLDLPEHTRPTGIFFASDEMACGFISEVQHRGLRVPEHVSVVGFDDVEIVAHFSPSLTTVRQPREAIGRTAAQELLALMNAQSVAAETILPVELVERASTRALPQR